MEKTEKRKAKKKKVSRNEELLKIFLEHAPAAIAMFDREMRYIMVSSRFLNDYGLKEQNIIGKSHYELFPEIPDRWKKIHKRCLGGAIVSEKEEPFPRQDGSIDWVRWEIRPWYESTNEVGGLILFSELITNRKTTEEALKVTMDALKKSNSDLEQFAYVASHDLQEPLRMITNFTKLMEKNLKGKLDEKTSDYMNIVIDGSMRMHKLINDLLSFSRISTRGEAFAPTDVNDIVNDVLSNLKFIIKENKAEIVFENLPVVKADKTQLVQLFQNLISNGIKFRKKESPCIRISAEKNGAEWLFSVKDNGIGINPKYFEKIFVIFQRLNDRDKYPGTGIGLSICKRIVERHGGKVWVESAEGQGTTFYFTLPE